MEYYIDLGSSTIKVYQYQEKISIIGRTFYLL